MDYPAGIWESIYFYVPDTCDLARIWMTGDHKARNSLLGVGSTWHRREDDDSAGQQENVIFLTSVFERLQELEFKQKRDARGALRFRPTQSHKFLPLTALQCIPRMLITLDLRESDLVIHPHEISALPTTLKTLKAMIGFLNESATAEFSNFVPVDLSAVQWPPLETLHFSGSLWKVLLSESAVRQLPRTLTDLSIGSATLDFEHALSNPFEHLVGLLKYEVVPAAMDKFFLPPNVTNVHLDFTERPSAYFELLPPSVRIFTAMRERKMRAPHIQFSEMAFGKLPRGLQSLAVHEKARFNDIETLRTTLPPGLTRVSFGKVPLSSLPVLPSTITDLGVELVHGELTQTLRELFPALMRISLVSSWTFSLPESFFIDWPLSLTEIRLGTQEQVPSAFFENFRKLEKLKTFESVALLHAFTLDAFTHLPTSLNYLNMFIGDLPLTDEHIGALPKGLRVLGLLGVTTLTDAAVPLLPPFLDEFICPSSEGFTKASVKLWPVTLQRLQIGAHPSLSGALFAAEFKAVPHLELIYSTH
jgi:hypothetical protein